MRFFHVSPRGPLGVARGRAHFENHCSRSAHPEAKSFFCTSASPGVLISSALTHGAEELVDLFQGQRVVQRFQRVNGGHHGAAFEACSRAEETRCPEAHQEAPRDPACQRQPAELYTSSERSHSLLLLRKPCWTPRRHHTHTIERHQVHTAQTCSQTKAEIIPSQVRNTATPLAFWVSPNAQRSSESSTTPASVRRFS